MGNRCLLLNGGTVGEPEENLQRSKWSEGQGWDFFVPHPQIQLNHSKGTNQGP